MPQRIYSLGIRQQPADREDIVVRHRSHDDTNQPIGSPGSSTHGIDYTVFPEGREEYLTEDLPKGDPIAVQQRDAGVGCPAEFPLPVHMISHMTGGLVRWLTALRSRLTLTQSGYGQGY